MRYILCCSHWSISYNSGFSLVSIFWIQSLPSSVPISWLQCSWYCGLWGSTLTAVHCYTSSLHYQVNSLLVNCLISTIFFWNGSARFSKVLSNRNSVEGIWLLSIITYKYTADTCFNLLRCQKVSSQENTNEFVSLTSLDKKLNLLTELVYMHIMFRSTTTMDRSNAFAQHISWCPVLPSYWVWLLCFSSPWSSWL